MLNTNLSYYIPLKKAVDDFLKEQGLTPMDVVRVMDEDSEGIIESLRKRCVISFRTERKLLEKLTSKQLNFLVFVIQTFYIINIGGMYKGLLIHPRRDQVVSGQKVTEEGLRQILKALELPDID
ncbi:MAG: hypothetical protein QXQ66_06835 [Candidatus Hadarchaeum sp.]|uniref:hypothetical protein n=1 Tax=Candidatus Hadarchaeum sp. TaxID=2883567 RepID=UPI0031780F5A